MSKRGGMNLYGGAAIGLAARGEGRQARGDLHPDHFQYKTKTPAVSTRSQTAWADGGLPSKRDAAVD